MSNEALAALLYVTPWLAKLERGAREHEELIRSITARRPDLHADVVRDQIQRLATTTVFSAEAWANNCLGLAYANKPMPWESPWDK